MSRLSLFDSPFLLGFDRLERAIDQLAKSSGDGYPPYNIEQTGEDSLRITLAVAGFDRTDLSVTVEDRQLEIRGRQGDSDADGRMFLHRGIAARQFLRCFVLAEGIEAVDAQMESGLLHVDLLRPKVESRSRTIEIKGPTGDQGPNTENARDGDGESGPGKSQRRRKTIDVEAEEVKP
jgi:HSP20 family molecular chaperone IbpA